MRSASRDFDNAKARAICQARPRSKPRRPVCARRRSTSGYTKVTAPIAGRIGRALVTEGALVGQGEAPRLGRGAANRSAVCQFHRIGQRCFCAAQSHPGRSLQNPGKQAGAVHIVLDDGSLYEHAGQLLFTDLSVDASTGQVTLVLRCPIRTVYCCPASMCAFDWSRPRWPMRLHCPTGRHTHRTRRHGDGGQPPRAQPHHAKCRCATPTAIAGWWRTAWQRASR